MEKNVEKRIEFIEKKKILWYKGLGKNKKDASKQMFLTFWIKYVINYKELKIRKCNIWKKLNL